MHYQHQRSERDQWRERVAWLQVALAGLFALSGGLVVSVYVLIERHPTHFVPLPPVMTAPFSLSRHEVSATYVADLARYWVMLRFNYTPQTLAHQTQTLLRLVAPEGYGALKRSLIETRTFAQAHDVSARFVPLGATVDAAHQRVTVTGLSTRFVGTQAQPSVRERVGLRYRYQSGVLQLMGVTVTPDNPSSARQETHR